MFLIVLHFCRSEMPRKYEKVKVELIAMTVEDNKTTVSISLELDKSSKYVQKFGIIPTRAEKYVFICCFSTYITYKTVFRLCLLILVISHYNLFVFNTHKMVMHNLNNYIYDLVCNCYISFIELDCQTHST